MINVYCSARDWDRNRIAWGNQICIWSQKLSESSCITFKSLNRGHLAATWPVSVLASLGHPLPRNPTGRLTWSRPLSLHRRLEVVLTPVQIHVVSRLAAVTASLGRLLPRNLAGLFLQSRSADLLSRPLDSVRQLLGGILGPSEPMPLQVS